MDSAKCGVFSILISVSKQGVSSSKKAGDHKKYSSSLRKKGIYKPKQQQTLLVYTDVRKSRFIQMKGVERNVLGVER